MTRTRLRKYLDAILPGVCVVCGQSLLTGEDVVCGTCWARAPLHRFPRCARCGIALRDLGARLRQITCSDCRDWLPYLREARSPFAMKGTAAAIVHALKYGGWSKLADSMAEWMSAARFSAQVEAEIDALIPVPLGEARLRERGFNQAELLARAISVRRGWPLLTDVLRRAKDTRAQARLAPGDRAANVRGAFRALAGEVEVLRDAHLVLLDDVLTTGCTARDCVRALCVAGARSVSVLTFARARPDFAI